MYTYSVCIELHSIDERRRKAHTPKKKKIETKNEEKNGNIRNANSAPIYFYMFHNSFSIFVMKILTVSNVKELFQCWMRINGSKKKKVDERNESFNNPSTFLLHIPLIIVITLMYVWMNFFSSQLLICSDVQRWKLLYIPAFF